ncbi:MAG: hypothetical protein MHMPM18_004216 [Marteilia pararefringens]
MRNRLQSSPSRSKLLLSSGSNNLRLLRASNFSRASSCALHAIDEATKTSSNFVKVTEYKRAAFMPLCLFDLTPARLFEEHSLASFL